MLYRSRSDDPSSARCGEGTDCVVQDFNTVNHPRELLSRGVPARRSCIPPREVVCGISNHVILERVRSESLTRRLVRAFRPRVLPRLCFPTSTVFRRSASFMVTHDPPRCGIKWAEAQSEYCRRHYSRHLVEGQHCMIPLNVF